MAPAPTAASIKAEEKVKRAHLKKIIDRYDEFHFHLSFFQLFLLHCLSTFKLFLLVYTRQPPRCSRSFPMSNS
jgi:hypothetical protein